MVTVNAASLTGPMGLSSAQLSAANAEIIIDLAVDCLNLFGAEIANMSGTAGTKTLTATSAEKGGIILVARAIYDNFYRNLDNISIASLSISTPNVLGNENVLKIVQMVVPHLADIPFYSYNDPVYDESVDTW
jgi:hypothetical protein